MNGMIMLAASTIDYTALGTGLAVAFIAFMQVYGAWKQRQTAKTVDVIHTLTNSNMGAVKKTLAQVTAAKAILTNNEDDLKQAEAAMADFLDHVQRQSKVDAGTKTK